MQLYWPLLFILLKSMQINIFASETNNETDMNKRSWIIPILIIVVNALAIIVRWGSLSELLLAHFDLEGNAAGTMPRTTLIMYPLIAAAVCLAGYVIARIKQTLQTPLVILASGISLIVLFSTLVTLTSGKMPFFMLAEPVILLAAVVSSVVCLVKGRRKTASGR